MIRFAGHRSAHMFFFSSYAHHRHLHSFPTRRSSDLISCSKPSWWPSPAAWKAPSRCSSSCQSPPPVRPCGTTRSEEHTSELQSPVHPVCRLLLEKKKHLAFLVLRARISAGAVEPHAP